MSDDRHKAGEGGDLAEHGVESKLFETVSQTFVPIFFTHLCELCHIEELLVLNIDIREDAANKNRTIEVLLEYDRDGRFTELVLNGIRLMLNMRVEVEAQYLAESDILTL